MVLVLGSAGLARMGGVLRETLSGPAAVHVTFAEASLRHQEARPIGKVKRLRDSPRAAFPDLSILFPQL